ncbi:HdeD family acid-resistance protein [Haloferula chungangensis]|uniref:HdeD family acid-resistance protein n=1 Tax=Haloferula chungangensis TaxID=1048331 RepID=A0ABW2LB77_9BACT
MSTPESAPETSIESQTVDAMRQWVGARWWVLLLRGLLLMVLGIYALFNPGLSLMAWAFAVGCYLIADSVLALVAGFSGRSESRGWTIARGILGILAGVFVLGHPLAFGAIAALSVIFIIAGWSIFGGVMEIVAAIRERKNIRGEGWMILNGVFSILFGVVIAMAPLLAASLFIRFCGVLAIVLGIVAIWGGFKLRQFGQAK